MANSCSSLKMGCTFTRIQRVPSGVWHFVLKRHLGLQAGPDVVQRWAHGQRFAQNRFGPVANHFGHHRPTKSRKLLIHSGNDTHGVGQHHRRIRFPDEQGKLLLVGHCGAGLGERSGWRVSHPSQFRAQGGVFGLLLPKRFFQFGTGHMGLAR